MLAADAADVDASPMLALFVVCSEQQSVNRPNFTNK
jgi:hypothetical protein